MEKALAPIDTVLEHFNIAREFVLNYHQKPAQRTSIRHSMNVLVNNLLYVNNEINITVFIFI